MFPEFQKTTDKVRLFFLQKRADFGFRRHSSTAMAKNRSSSKVQALYDLCKKTFTPSGTPPPSPQAAQRLCSLLDTIGPADVGLSENVSEDDRGLGFFGLNRLDRVARWAQPITYIDIHECDSFTMCIFCFPTSAVIPLHDHPGMNVFSKVLYGSLHVKAYDWVEPPCFPNEDRSVLYPKTGGNLHCFTAITPCAVLDILSPPYREDAGRKCTYYHDYPYFTFSNEGEKSDNKENYAWLSEIETPEDLYMRSGKYMGPAVEV
ncbi:plant cysteine oxidase 3 isoform X2 [Punica granatum]|uniref:cysteine dioxygenase n=1 Tax=Punica granatum TaxID=22663 RepID=A0A6P8EIS2_PUNGR|nr:plant cysteine oxidase 3 isoform X2 [Punica granatum]